MTTRGYEFSFPLFALGYDEIYTPRVTDAQEAAGGAMAGSIQLAPKLRYLQLLLRCVDLWSGFNERPAIEGVRSASAFTEADGPSEGSRG